MRNKVVKAFCKVPMNLQLFAEGGDGAGVDGGNGGGSGEGEGAGGEGGTGGDTPPSFDDFLKTGSNQAEFDRRVQKAVNTAVTKAQEKWQALADDKLSEAEKLAKMTKEEKAQYMQQKMIKAFQLADVRESHLWGSTGYGYDDAGREALDKVYAYVFDAEDALVRHNFVSGTHALTVALFGVLRPGDTMLSITGMPYDTIRSAIGIEGDYPGSLKDFSIKFEMTELNPDGTLDYDKIASDIAEKKPKMVYIQRSRGYSTRPTLTWREIKKLCEISKANSPESIIMLDNCYGEFIDKVEPLSVGVDMMAGSLIKNPGGGIAPTGGYIAGKKELVEMCAYRLTTPGTGKEIGATLNANINQNKN